MFNTIAYYLGFCGDEQGLSSEEGSVVPAFNTRETEDHWTLVDINSKKNEDETELNDFPTPPPSPKLEQSWLLTPPPCFNAENSSHVEQLSPRENLLIEHPSIFVKPAGESDDKTVAVQDDKKAATSQAQPHKKVATVSRVQRRAARQALQAISQQNKRNYQFKKTGSEVTRRNNKAFKCIKQRVQQPRKHN